MKLQSLAAAMAALIVVAGTVFGVRLYAQARLHQDFERLALGNLKSSRLGLAADEAVLKHRDYLPVYGSCELVYPQKNRIDRFFATKPTGFRVAPTGDRGVRSLAMAQRFAALGERLRGKQLVVILTPEWFYVTEPTAATYEGNFSVEHALAGLSSPTLDPVLKRRLAIRMEDYPESLQKNPFLAQLSSALASDSPAQKAVLPLVSKLARGFVGLQRILDPVVTNYGLREWCRAHPDKAPTAQPQEIDWNKDVADSIQEFQELSGDNPYGFRDTLWAKFQKDPETYLHRMSDRDFANRLARTKEWEDYDLMLAILKHYGAKPLLISLPVNGKFLAAEGVSRDQWWKYYAAINNVAERYGFPVADFNKFEDDPQFFGYADPNPEGWIYINQVVDAYYHGKLNGTLGVL